MNIVLTGSLGYIGRPLTQKLVKKGHSVTVISSNPEREKEIESLGAKPAIGNMDDADFLTTSFSGSDAVYCMIALEINFTDPENNASKLTEKAKIFANNYFEAIIKSGVKRVIYLSSIGADMKQGNGLIAIHHNAENILKKLPSEVGISFIRPAGFYKGLFNYIPAIKHNGFISANYGGDDIVVWVSNLDIADAIVEELESDTTDRKVRYVASEEIGCNELASILGTAIGKPDLKWEFISDEQQLNALISFGMQESFAQNFTEMNASIHSGKFYEDYYQNKPTLGQAKLKEFAVEFAEAYNKQ